MNFTQMVEAEIPALRRHARAVTRDSDLADDIVQDTLVREARLSIPEFHSIANAMEIRFLFEPS
jgi:DNA-directed RNA polymerase specialized sigma24 family protein